MTDIVAGDGIVARLGGDEFAVCLPGFVLDRAVEVGEQIASALEDEMAIVGTTVTIAGSVGIAMAPDHGRDVAAVQRGADLAMFDAKAHHSRVQVFTGDVDTDGGVRLSLLGELRRALDDDALEVAYQPQVGLADGRLRGVEALVRWNHPEFGAVLPREFVPLAERAGLIDQLTDVVLARALTDLRALDDQGYDLRLSMNISVSSLVVPGFPDRLAAAFAEAGVAPERVTLEITEGAMIGDSPGSVNALQRLDELGVVLSVADFGTGFSSLAVLRTTPLRELKIDRRFVLGMDDGVENRDIVAAAIQIGTTLGLTVVAEGVETVEVERWLRERGCDVGQGFGIAQPLHLEALELWLTAYHLPGAAARDAISTLERAWSAAEIVLGSGGGHVAFPPAELVQHPEPLPDDVVWRSQDEVLEAGGARD